MEQGCSASEPAESHSLRGTESPFGPSISVQTPSGVFDSQPDIAAFQEFFLTRHMTGFPFYFMAE